MTLQSRETRLHVVVVRRDVIDVLMRGARRKERHEERDP